MSDEIQVRKDEAKGMLPGVAAICIFLLVLTLANVFAVAAGFYEGGGRIGVLAFCAMSAAGVYGLLRLRRWGWALVLAECVVLSIGYFYLFARMHAPHDLMRALIALAFFLYLARTEVRERLR